MVRADPPAVSDKAPAMDWGIPAVHTAAQLAGPPPGISGSDWAHYPSDIREQLKFPDYRHHIVAVDQFGSARLPVVTVTGHDAGGNPDGWSVSLPPLITEDTQHHVYRFKDADGNPRYALRKQFIEYLEDQPNTTDGFGEKRGTNAIGLFENYRRLLKAGAVNHVVIFIHGGLVSINDGAATACALTHAMLADKAYPIFICWSSNLLDTYQEHLFSVREGIRSKEFAPATAPLQFLADVGGAATRAPLAMVKLFRNDIYHLDPTAFSRASQAQLREDDLKKAEDSPGLTPSELPLKLSGGLRGYDMTTDTQRTGDFASWLFWLGAKVATTPIIDTLGSPSWFNMVRRTRVMFERESTFVNEEVNKEMLQRAYDRGRENAADLKDQIGLRWESRQGALRIFFDSAQNELQWGPPGSPTPQPQISLIGHSMGAIIAGEILTRYNGIRFDNIVFMAAASTVNDFKIKVVPYLQNHALTRFYNLCLDPGNETGEREPFNYAEVAPRGSLLVWIDSLFDSPDAEDDRTMGRWENAVLGMDWLPSNANGDRITIKAFGRNRTLQLSDTGPVPITGVPYPYDDHPQVGRKFLEPAKHGMFTQYGNGVHPSFPFWRPYYWTAEPIPPGLTSATIIWPPLDTTPGHRSL